MEIQEIINELRKSEERVQLCKDTLKDEEHKRDKLIDALNDALGSDICGILNDYWND